MFDWDVIIVGGGPAGLSAGLYLGRAGQRVMILEKETFGGQIKNVEWIENYPGFADGISGAQLGSQMVSQAKKYGTALELAEVVEIDFFSSCINVDCADGKEFTTSIVIVTGGCQPKKLGVPGEKRLRGKGVINCALCDGGQFVDRTVAVCGGGDSGVTEALYMTNIASKVILIEAEAHLTATKILHERALANSKLEIRCGTKVSAIQGDQSVEAIELVKGQGNEKEIISVDGVLVHSGIEPNTSYLEDIVQLNGEKQIVVNEKMETEIAGLLAAGDIRSGSSRQIATAVGDGAIAALSALRILREI